MVCSWMLKTIINKIYINYVKVENFFITKKQNSYEKQLHKTIQIYLTIFVKLYVIILLLFLICSGTLSRELNNFRIIIDQLFNSIQKYDLYTQFSISIYNNITVNIISTEFYTTIIVFLALVKMYIKALLVKNVIILYCYSHISKIFFIKILTALLLLISIRTGLPRFRYDTLSKSSWNIYIPLVLIFIIFISIGFLK